MERAEVWRRLHRQPCPRAALDPENGVAARVALLQMNEETAASAEGYLLDAVPDVRERRVLRERVMAARGSERVQKALERSNKELRAKAAREARDRG